MGLGATVKRMASRITPWAAVVSGRTDAPFSVALTFDDGPHPENTPSILDTLDTHAARATFFLQGDMASHQIALVREIVSRGHQIGNHGHAHRDARAVSTKEYVADVLRCQSVLEDIVGRELPRNFRPPFGHVAAGSTIALLRRKFRFVFWSLDSCDSFLPDSRALVKHVTSQRISAGSILLFHDDNAHTTEALPQLVAHLEKLLLRMVSLDELLSDGARGPAGRSP